MYIFERIIFSNPTPRGRTDTSIDIYIPTIVGRLSPIPIFKFNWHTFPNCWQFICTAWCTQCTAMCGVQSVLVVCSLHAKSPTMLRPNVIHKKDVRICQICIQNWKLHRNFNPKCSTLSMYAQSARGPICQGSIRRTRGPICHSNKKCGAQFA